MRKILKISFTPLVSAAVMISLLGAARFIGKESGASGPVFQKGMCYTTWNKDTYRTAKSYESLKRLKALNVEWLAVLTTWYQDSCFSTKIFPTAKTPSDESVKEIIEKAHSLGMKVMLKPHLDLLSTSEGGWRGEIACIREPDWQVWFNQYKSFILHYAKIAEETGAEMLCIGTELTAATAGRADDWKDIISAIKKVYKGNLTYAANWSEEYLQIRFWDELDYVGIDAYFPLSNEDRPTYEAMMEGWKRWISEIEQWQKMVNKPVIFPEVGYRSSLGA